MPRKTQRRGSLSIKPSIIHNELFLVEGKPNMSIGIHTGMDEYSLTLNPWEVQKVLWFLEKYLDKYKIFMGPGEGWDLPDPDSKYGKKIKETGEL